MMYGRRRRLSAEETAANAAAREARKQAAMTCQVCANAILANKGVIAHHGYQRPGHGWQTDSCMGARELPYEVSRDTLGVWIVVLEGFEARTLGRIADIANERAPIQRSVGSGKYDFKGKETQRVFSFTRETFEAIKEAEKRFFIHSYGATFDSYKEQDRRAVESELRLLRLDLTDARKRFAAWTLTHQMKVSEHGGFIKWAKV